MIQPPTFEDVLAARRTLRGMLQPTPLFNYPLLDELVGCEVWVKHENYQPIGSFKLRGGLNLVSKIAAESTPDAARRRGVISASTGNHGQSIAWAARAFDVPATIVVPEGANSAKVASIRALGASVEFCGSSFDEARVEAERRGVADGLHYVHSANEPDLIAGVATYTLEILEEVPDLDVLIVPVGGGSQASGAGLVLDAVRPRTRLIGVQSSSAPAVCRSWEAGQPVGVESTTIAEGLATGAAFELTLRMLCEHLDEFVLVSDDELVAAVRVYLERVRNLVEPAGAASLAAALKIAADLRGEKVAVVISGANIATDQLRDLLADE